MQATGRTPIRATSEATRAAMLDTAVLARVIPGAERVTCEPDGSFTAILGFGIGRFRGRQTVTLRLVDESATCLTVSGRATGPFGSGQAVGRIDLHPHSGGTLLAWSYAGNVRGPMTLAGPYLLRRSATAFTARVFARFRGELERRLR